MTACTERVEKKHQDGSISLSVLLADEMAEDANRNMNVVISNRFGVCIYNDDQLRKAANEIDEIIYTTVEGFIVAG